MALAAPRLIEGVCLMIRTTKYGALSLLAASHEFEANRQFLPPEIYDYFSSVIELTYTAAHQA
jgi:hypothetical protein